VLQAPDVTLKMSTALEETNTSAQGMRLAHAISKTNLRQLKHPIPRPAQQCFTTRKNTKINMATRTSASSKDRDSEVRQRCGCKIRSSYAEICSAPSSRRHVEDVHSIGVDKVGNCARHETCTRNQQDQPPPTQASHHPTRTTQHNTQKYENQHGNTYLCLQRRSRLRDSATMWLQVLLEPR
jgi:hypothetical protein